MDARRGQNRLVLGSWSAAVGAAGTVIRVVGNHGVPTASTWPANNRAIYLPFTLTYPFNMRRIWWLNGSTASGNVDAGVYSVGGTRLFSIGSTAQAGTLATQSAALAGLLTPGSYYMALVMSATTSTVYRINGSAYEAQAAGMAQEALGATTLPATFTLATPSTGHYPVFGISAMDTI